MDGEFAEFGTPGQLIRGLLEARGWTQRTLAVILDLGESTVTRLVSDRQHVDAPLALLLEEVLGVAGAEFLSRQADLDLMRARRSHLRDPARTLRIRLYGDLPVSEMIARGWLDAEDIRDRAKVEAGLMRFFAVDRIEDILNCLRAPPVGPAHQLAWLYRARQIAGCIAVAPNTPRAARAALPRLRALTAELESIARVPRLLAECGIRFVIVEPLAGARLDGACFWLGNHAPVIALSLRVDRIDHFWFVLRHELEHVLQRQGRDTALLDAELGGDRAGTGPGIPKAERRANDAAREFCVSTAALDEFIARKAPYFSEREMVRFARSLAVHPGILAGRLQPRTGPDRFHAHIARVRATLLPHAASDGWGRTHRP